MNNVITKLQTCNFVDDSEMKYFELIAPKIIDLERPRKLFCDFDAISKSAAKKLCTVLQQIGFEANIDDFDEKRVEAIKEVSYQNAKNALNLAMYEAWKHSSDLTTLMLDQDIAPIEQ